MKVMWGSNEGQMEKWGSLTLGTPSNSSLESE